MHFKIGPQIQKNETGLLLTLYTKINSKYNRNMNEIPEIINFLEENIWGKFLDIGLTNDFLDLITKAKATKTKSNKWDYIKLKNLCATKETINKMKSQTMEWEKIFSNHVPGKELINPKYIKNSYNSITKNPN